MIPLSVLDHATVATGSTPAQALQETTEMSRIVERLGYYRHWVGEYHSMSAIASSAPSVLVAHLANATSTLRIGAGGVILPNHSPLAVAEQFGTLEALHPGRIDLGLGRAPGTDPQTAQALRRATDRGVPNREVPNRGADTFPDDVTELINYLLPREGPPSFPFANPGSGYLPEVWWLGSSTFSAQLAGMLGLPFAFAYHFAPNLLDPALSIYRSTFQPSLLLERPRVMVAVSVLCAPTADEAQWLRGSTALSILQRRSGDVGLFSSPEEADAYPFSLAEKTMIDEVLATHVIGDPQAVREGLDLLQRRTQADELMISTRTHSHQARERSFTLVARSWGLVPLNS
jgi:luciferase family oxidoreductase group 1